MLYDVKCDKCGGIQEIVRTVAERDKDLPRCCGEDMHRIISRQNVHPDFEPYLDDNIASTQDNYQPVWVKSKKHRRQLMKEHGVVEAYGKGWY